MKKLLVAVISILLVLLGTPPPLPMPRPSRITRENFDRIQVGMSQTEVEGILGGPPGDYRTRPVSPVPSIADFGGSYLVGSYERWEGDEGAALVFFEDGGTVGGKEFTETGCPKRGALENLRWRWNRWRKSLFK